MSADGKIAGKDRRQLRISSKEDMERVNRLRRSSDAIMVGVGTVLSDDPKLTVKGSNPAENPLRVVVDSRGRTPPEAKVLDDSAPTLILCTEECNRDWGDTEAVKCGSGRVDLCKAMKVLADRGVQTLMVEGGGELIASLFDAGLVDEYLVFIGPLIIGGRSSPTPVDGEGREGKDAIQLHFVDHERYGDGVLLHYHIRRTEP